MIARNARRITAAAVLLAVACSGAVGAPISMEAGNVALDATSAGQTTFQQVTFQQVYDVVPIVVTVASNEGSDSYSVRIRNVTTTGFEIAQPYWEVTTPNPFGFEIVAGDLTEVSVGNRIIPEPSTLAIWTLGLLALAWYARRRRSK